MFRFTIRDVLWLMVVVARPSTRAKCKGGRCPQCGKAIIAGVELGEAVYGRPGGRGDI